MNLKDYEIVRITHMDLYCDDEIIGSWDVEDGEDGEIIASVEEVK